MLTFFSAALQTRTQCNGDQYVYVVAHNYRECQHEYCLDQEHSCGGVFKHPAWELYHVGGQFILQLRWSI